MNKIKIYLRFFSFVIIAILSSCGTKDISTKLNKIELPNQYSTTSDSLKNIMNWKDYFNDENLITLIDSALKNNQELNVLLQEIEINKNEVKARKGEYLPFVNFGAKADVDKAGRFTRIGALEHEIDLKPGKEFPEPMSNQAVGLYSTLEIDVWKKLRNAKKSAMMNYLASVDGKNFMQSKLVAEIAQTYYELIALDNQLEILEKNIEIQTNALEVVKLQKAASGVNQLAVNRFEAQLLNTKGKQFEINQKIIEKENRMKFLVGNVDIKIARRKMDYSTFNLLKLSAGIPIQLLENRLDVRKAEYELAAAKLNVKVARSNFYPSIGLKAGLGYEAFKPSYILHPESMMYGLGADLFAPLLNRNAIKAMYRNANAEQVKALLNYNQTLINAYLEVSTNMQKISNYASSIDLKSKEVKLLIESIDISNNLFNSARADYMEVLLTQREALESKMELIEMKSNQVNAAITMYQALGGGWK